MSDEMNNNGMSDLTDDDKLWGALSLAIPLVGLIALLMEDKKARPFIKYAAVHGLGLSVIMAVLSVVPLVQCITPLIWIYAIYLGVQAYGGNWVVVPGLTDLAKGQGWI